MEPTMTERNPIVVLLLGCITFGIYPLIWMVSTKDEMVQQGAEIPTAWLLLVPIISLIWTWKWCQGVEHVTRGETSAVVALLMMAFLGPIGMFVIQGAFNKRALPAAA
jgi:hypothetical protein